MGVNVIGGGKAGGGAGNSSDDLEVTYPGGGDIGRVVQLLSSGSVANLPLETWSLGTNYISYGSPALTAGYKSMGMYDTTDPTVKIMTSHYAPSGSSQSLYAWLVRFNPDGTVTKSASHYSLFTSTYASLESAQLVRVGETNTYILYFGYQTSSTSSVYVVYALRFVVDPAALTASNFSAINTGITSQMGTYHRFMAISINAINHVLVAADSLAKVVRGAVVTVSPEANPIVEQPSSVLLSATKDLNDIYIEHVGEENFIVRGGELFAAVVRSGNTFSAGAPITLPGHQPSDYAAMYPYHHGTSTQPYTFNAINPTRALYVYSSATPLNEAPRIRAAVFTITGTTLSATDGIVYYAVQPYYSGTGTVSQAADTFDLGDGYFCTFGTLSGYTGTAATGTNLYYGAVFRVEEDGSLTLTPDKGVTLDQTAGWTGYLLGHVTRLPDGTFITLQHTGTTSVIFHRIKYNPQTHELGLMSSYTVNSLAPGTTNYYMQAPIFVAPNDLTYLFIENGTGSSSGASYYRVISSYERGRVVGVQQENGRVLLRGLSKVHNDLTPGVTYYYDSNGRLTTVSRYGTLLGRAISNNEILMDDLIFTD
jgi:hypothetical protein